MVFSKHFSVCFSVRLVQHSNTSSTSGVGLGAGLLVGLSICLMGEFRKPVLKQLVPLVPQKLQTSHLKKQGQD